MSRLVPKAKDLATKAAAALKQKVQKYFPPESLAAAVGLVDSLNLNRVTLLSQRLLRDLRAHRDVAVEALLRKLTRRLDEVIRTTGNTLKDLSDLAADVEKMPNPSELTAVTARLRTYQTQCNRLLDAGERIVRFLRRLYPGMPDQKLRRTLRIYQARSAEVDQLFTRCKAMLTTLGNREGSGE